MAPYLLVDLWKHHHQARAYTTREHFANPYEVLSDVIEVPFTSESSLIEYTFQELRLMIALFLYIPSCKPVPT
jgi:hypothetical protein